MTMMKIISRSKTELDPLEYSAPYAVVGEESGVIIREFLRREDAVEWLEFKKKQEDD